MKGSFKFSPGQELSLKANFMLHMGRGGGSSQRKKYQQGPAEGKNKVLPGDAGPWVQRDTYKDGATQDTENF